MLLISMAFYMLVFSVCHPVCHCRPACTGSPEIASDNSLTSHLAGSAPGLVSGDDVVQLINQLRSLEYDLCSSLLKILNHKHLILIVVAVPVFMNMVSQPTGNVSAVVGNRLPVKDHQHSLKVC